MALLGLAVGGYGAGSGSVAGIYIATSPSYPSYHRIIWVNPQTGDRTSISTETLAQGPLLGYFGGICIENSTSLLARSNSFYIYRVNRQTGYRDIISSPTGFGFTEHGDIAMQTSSRLLVGLNDYKSLGAVNLANGGI